MFFFSKHCAPAAASLVLGASLALLTGCGSSSSTPAGAGSAASVPGVTANVLQGDSLAVPQVAVAFPDSDYKAELKLKSPATAPASVKAGSSIDYEVTITNQGKSAFPAFTENQSAGMVNLTCRTYTAQRKEPAGGCNRAVLPHDLKPGESVTVTLPVPAPAKPGAYEIHIELVHEGVLWFEDKNSPSLILKYQVK